MFFVGKKCFCYNGVNSQKSNNVRKSVTKGTTVESRFSEVFLTIFNFFGDEFVTLNWIFFGLYHCTLKLRNVRSYTTKTQRRFSNTVVSLFIVK